MPGDSSEFESFSGSGVHGEIAAAHRPEDPVAELARLTDPSAAVATIHWGRNYLYAAELDGRSGVVPVVVKQFRNQGWRRRLERRLRGSKAARSWRVAKELVRAGLATPEPVALVESDRSDGPSTFVARRLDGAVEVRHFFRALNGEPDPGPFPEVETIPFLEQLGRQARRLHDAGIVYRDLSMGNILAVGQGPEPELYLVDFNRARVGQRPGVWRRTRDICRLPVLRREHREAFLRGYWGQVPPRRSPRWWLYGLSVDTYIAKHAIKNRLEPLRLRRRHAHRNGHYPHIPPARQGAGRRDLAVWDHLSDQPHQHAGRWAKRAIRLADSPDHLRELADIARSAPKIRARYRELARELGSAPVPFEGIGLCLRPCPEATEAHLAAVEELGVRRILLRLHPWQDDHDAEEGLARELHRRGCDLVFALPQVRELVRDPARWRSAVAELGARFVPFGRTFQIGQAVNRSKWGIWTRAEYVQLYRAAAEELRALGDVELAGPAVIDFELQVTAALANRLSDGLRFDVLASLLYVDRRGAPENRQLGFDTVDKVLLLKAIADTGRNTAGRSWITEVNWPLWEGPHSPAGKTVSVDEPTQADYLVRFYLLALGTGAVERVYWWRLLARGYGVVAPEPDGSLRRRPAWHALRTLIAELEGTTFLGPLAAPDGVWLYRFRRPDDEVVVAWSLEPDRHADLPAPASRAIGRDGDELPPPDGTRIDVGPSPVYYILEA
ncbi:MAG TPA: lipopolysaccharide kinase InaA family protein [Candidatus Sulfomarinibacteraceae bacterium]|nr:lipopolysaccharide kinase InaA family protein [Candidatus Sulfomarinibacteraceae bacterium]